MGQLVLGIHHASHDEHTITFDKAIGEKLGLNFWNYLDKPGQVPHLRQHEVVGHWSAPD